MAPRWNLVEQERLVRKKAQALTWAKISKSIHERSSDACRLKYRRMMSSRLRKSKGDSSSSSPSTSPSLSRCIAKKENRDIKMAPRWNLVEQERLVRKKAQALTWAKISKIIHERSSDACRLKYRRMMSSRIRKSKGDSSSSSSPSTSPSLSRCIAKKENRDLKMAPRWNLAEQERLVKKKAQGLTWAKISKSIHERSSDACRLKYRRMMSSRLRKSKGDSSSSSPSTSPSLSLSPSATSPSSPFSSFSQGCHNE